MATIKIALDERRIKKDGTHPVVLRIYHENKYLTIKTHVDLAKKYWDSSTSTIKKGHPQYKQINHRLKELELEQSGKLMDLHKKYPNGFSLNHLKTSYEGKNIPATLQSFWEDEIELLIKSQKYGNARINKIALGVLGKITNLEIPIEEVNYSFLSNIEVKLLQKGLKKNSISCYFRALRAIYNVALNKELVDSSLYPFRRFKIKSEKTVPSVLSSATLQKLFSLEIPNTHNLYKGLLLSKLIFLLGGINFTDLVQLKVEDIKNGRIIYRRSKTKKIYSILVLAETEKIIQELMQNNTSTICGVLSNKDLESGDRLPYIIRDKNKQLNKKLVKLGDMCNAELTIKSYTFRYSIANLCKQIGYDISLISELLGHSYGSAITRGYVEAYDKKKLDDMLKDVCKLVFEPHE